MAVREHHTQQQLRRERHAEPGTGQVARGIDQAAAGAAHDGSISCDDRNDGRPAAADLHQRHSPHRSPARQRRQQGGSIRALLGSDQRRARASGPQSCAWSAICSISCARRRGSTAAIARITARARTAWSRTSSRSSTRRSGASKASSTRSRPSSRPASWCSTTSLAITIAC